MNNRVFMLKSVADFAPGSFENTLVEGGSIQLGRNSGAYLHSGCYTSPAFRSGRFRRLIPSWNADTPPGTAVEVQARVVANGQWSRWFSFGRWSPYINRSSHELEADALAKVEGEWLQLVDESAVADMMQLRVYLYTNEPQATPLVHLLAASTDRIVLAEDKTIFVDRVLEIPNYSCLVRDPSLAQRIAGPTSLTMLMNRWGEDVLPEEIARAGYDNTTGRYGNLAFVAAVGGTYGYECYNKFASVNYLREEIRKSRAVGALVRYRSPSLDGQQERKDFLALPELPGAYGNSTGHLLVVRGFSHKGEKEFVVVNDPMAPSDTSVYREIALEKFEEIYTGLCLVLHKGVKGAGAHKPNRIVTMVEVDADNVRFSSHGEALLPGQNIPGDSSRATICYTLSDGVVYASAAQKKFYYIDMAKNGKLGFDHTMAIGKKVTFYLIGSRGATWVGEQTVLK